MAVPNIFGTATSAIPLSQLDTNFATPVTIGNTAVQLGNTVTSFGNVTLTNVTISSGNVTITGANVSGTANVSTLVVTGNQTSLGNVTVTGNISANIVTVSAGSNTAPSITTTGDTNTGIFFPAADTIAFSEGGVEAMRIDSAGNVGIGTTSPVNSGAGITTLTVNGTTQSGAIFQVANVSTGFIYSNASDSGLGTLTATPYRFLTNSAEAMRITSAGDVGIGTTTPLFTFANRGSLTINGTNQALLCLSNGSSLSTSAYHIWDGTNYSINNNSTTGSLVFGTNAASERMRIDSSGNLLVGTSSATGKVSIKGSGASTGINFYVGNSNGNDVVFTRDNGEVNTSSLASSPYNNNVGAVRTLMVTSAGVLGYNASTRNTKTNITPLTSVNWLFDLDPVSFNYREKDEQGNYTDVAKADVHYGLIAEDTETVNKELCFYNADGSLAGVNYDMLAPALLKAIQEQQALIQSLTTRITTLETK